ncbi:helix-turn-helix domain-containing protein [Paenibacillus polymyxa]|uniref:helix-turn-helix domain-containing protein n=1 Tax=Paenibacillus polymyxa TaxID=1406 RepID=UPI0025B70F18|nr:helix-turn-helix transcriptional regulator [Paenibacillus polymyxa]MDN4106458.1 helix-turn-helix transcriptional regulator [Paenibacillus polymyxa]
MEKKMYNFQDFDPVKVGVNLRKARQNAKVSIANLSKNVNISVGKISSIEKGKIHKDYYDEINSIAESLNIPVANILNDDALLKPPIEKYTSDLELAQQFVTAGLLNEAKRLTEKIKITLSSREQKWVHPALLFTQAEIYSSSGLYKEAKAIYKRIINLSGNHSLLNHYRVRSLNALACRAFNQNEIIVALNFTKRADVRFDKNLSAEQRYNTYLNMSLLYSFVGYTDIAIFHAHNAEKISQENLYYLTEIKFTLGVLYLIKDNKDRAYSYISESLSFYQKIKDSDSINNMYKCFYILYKIDRFKYSEIRDFFEANYLTLVDKESFQIEYLHLWIEQLIEEKRLDNIEPLLDWCMGMVNKVSAHTNYKTYWLASNFYKLSQQLTKQNDALKSALYFVDENMNKEKGFILFELATLKENEKSSPFYEVASIFQDVIKKYEHKHKLDKLLYLLPKPRY